MRPQQNRRMRGRGGNNNRKGPNPLTRSYESNGPDVKIRGTAQQVAEKYTTLARDAQSSGDRVMAENYLQHAEHYNRIIAAAQPPQQMQQQHRDGEEDDDDRETSWSGDEENPRQSNGGSGPQPVIDGMPAEVALEQGDFDRARSTRQADEGRVNGTGAHEASEENAEAGEGRQRRPRRPRRPRAEAEGADAGDGGEAAEAAEADPEQAARPRRGRAPRVPAAQE